jgi:hypothetical protein
MPQFSQHAPSTERNKPSPACSDGHTSIDRQSWDMTNNRGGVGGRDLRGGCAADDTTTVISSLTPDSPSERRPSVNRAEKDVRALNVASWQCAICTLVNVATYLVCEACGTTKNAVVI